MIHDEGIPNRPGFYWVSALTQASAYEYEEERFVVFIREQHGVLHAGSTTLEKFIEEMRSSTPGILHIAFQRVAEPRRRAQ